MIYKGKNEWIAIKSNTHIEVHENASLGALTIFQQYNSQTKELTVQLPVVLPEMANMLMIYNTEGVMVAQQKIEQLYTVIALSTLHKGVYVTQLITQGDLKYSSYKFMVP